MQQEREHERAMQTGTGVSKPKRAAKGCRACRLSKTRCVMPAEDPQESGTACVRCTRLALTCVFDEKNNRGQRCVARDKARLGPAVRALLQATTESDSTCNATLVVAELEKTQAADGEMLSWCGDQCQRKMVLSIESMGGRLALLKHWLLIGIRSGNCGTLPCRTSA